MAARILIVDDYEMKEGTRSHHQRFRVPSEKMNKLKQVLLKTLEVFHRYAEDHQIYYSLSGGSLIGFYCSGDMIPWDDDIDVETRLEDVSHLMRLWHSGAIPKNITKYERGFNNSYTRLIGLYGEKFEIMINNPTFTPGTKWLMKLRPVDHDCFDNVPGGLDIATVYSSTDGKLINSWDLRTLGIDPKNMTSTDSPVVEFGGVQTRALRPEIGTVLLTRKYGEKWSIKQHPSIKLGQNG